ncbi:MAG: HDIG domain-containing protein [Balneola sp.]|nr:HDIG domain-containing protein [Balneola sp.]MBO6651020.1 HDIG domain-containing protein [Balneola sp.]MBO6711181.1 HDIG domain-containing protein [Balneola sp.]MBO6800704.1 HDIG domain-containing protein [Balneola sp.]MBO6869117.1 HDIG domain-containing protein [Balneola sp.]
MSLLDKIGLGRKKNDRAPLVGEKLKKEQEKYSLKRNPYLRAFIFICFIGISILSLPNATINSGLNYTVGQPWRAEDLVAPYTFAINKTADEIQKEEDQIRNTVSPVFNIDPNVEIGVQTKVDSLYRNIQPVIESYFNWQESKQQNLSSVFDDSIRFAQEYTNSEIQLTERSWNVLFDSYYFALSNNRPINSFIGVQVKQELESVIENLMDDGIINRTKASIGQNEIVIRDVVNSTERLATKARVRDLREANEFAQFQLNRRFEQQIAQLGMELYNKVIQSNLIYSEQDTQARIQEQLSEISTTKGAITQGQMIIRRGDIVTQQSANVLESLSASRSQNASNAEKWLRFAGGIIAICMISLVFFMYLFLYRRPISSHNGLFFLVFLTMGLISLASAILLRYDISSIYVIPIAIAPIILTIIFDSRVGIIASVTLAALIGMVNGNDFEFTIATICACSMGVFSVRDIKDRSQFFFTTPGVVFISYIIVIGAFSLAKLSGWESFFNQILFIAINSLFILFTYPIILLFEKLFGITTDFTLLEMSDTNRPLLKELMNKAPGTFHHSLQVANLSEAAAAAIKANSLLCRVGALYHDIGKMIKPSYFVENQGGGTNEHDKLKPQMSAMIIKAHVSEGVKMAEEAGLPKTIISFIESHHGTSVIRYFYEKAKEDDNLKEMLNEEQFRYEGPLPATKETGILLLADGIEAASRAMKNPNYNKLENLVNKMVDDRVAEDQLSKCPLTFRDLSVIKETFINILVGVYHGRIEYPEEKKGKESAKQENTNSVADDTTEQNVELPKQD